MVLHATQLRPRTLALWACVAAFVATGAVGCSGTERTRLPVDGPQTAAAVLARARAVPLARSVQGMARMDAWVDGEARKGNVLIVIERPDRAHFQALTPTIDMIAVLATDGQRFISFERGADRCLVGRACAANMARLVPLELPPGELVDAILGRLPVITGSQTLSWDTQRDAYLIEIRAADGRTVEQVWIQARTFRFLGTVLHVGGKRVASLAYDEVTAWGAGGPPRTLRVQVEARKLDLSLRLREIEIDAPADAEVFAPTCPSGMLQVELPCAPTPSVPLAAEPAAISG